MERIQASLAKEGKKKKIIYLGDGIGDFCPTLKLKEGDFVMPRKNFPVWDLINQNRTLVKAEIHEWTNGEDQESTLLRLIATAEAEAEAGEILLPTVDQCKLQTIPLSTYECLPPIWQAPRC